MSAKAEKAGWLKGVIDRAAQTQPAEHPSLDDLAKVVADARNALVHCQAEKERWAMRETEASDDLKEAEKMFFEALDRRGIHAVAR